MHNITLANGDKIVAVLDKAITPKLAEKIKAALSEALGVPVTCVIGHGITDLIVVSGAKKSPKVRGISL